MDDPLNCLFISPELHKEILQHWLDYRRKEGNGASVLPKIKQVEITKAGEILMHLEGHGPARMN